MDGNTSGRYNQNSCTHTHNTNKAWWQVDLEKTQPIGKVIVYNRADCCGNRLNNFNVYADAHKCGTIATAAAKNTIDCKKVEAQKVKVQLNSVNYLTLCEVEVYSPITHYASLNKCREASEEDDQKCSRLGMSY